MAYINFFPGDMRNERHIEVADLPAYGGAADLSDFIDSMNRGCTASIEADGIKARLEDGEVLGDIMDELGIDEDTMQELAEELHAAL